MTTYAKPISLLCRLLRKVFVVWSLTLPAVTYATTFDISAVNNTGVDVFDIHVLITGTGGTIHNLVAINPLVQALDAGPGNEVNGFWVMVQFQLACLAGRVDFGSRFSNSPMISSTLQV